MRYYAKAEIDTSFAGRWEMQAYTEFAHILNDNARPFPCTLGIAGWHNDQLRYAFIDHAPLVEQGGNEAALQELAASLQSYLPNARLFGKNTSLVVFFNETRDQGVPHYEQCFWNLLNGVHRLDSRPWPTDIATNPSDSSWEFSFAGQAMFVVCNTPSHRRRHSRYHPYFMLSFQPRWVFEDVIGPTAANAQKVRSEIRKRLHEFDEVAITAFLGSFGAAENREWHQYFLRDDNSAPLRCPFKHAAAAPRAVLFQQTGHYAIETVIRELLPPTGSVEVQFDTPNREHAWHSHATDETLHVIEGSMQFATIEQVFVCQPGDRILLPAQTIHRSVAGPAGCLYVIATRMLRHHLIN
ncbi:MULTISPECIES: YqcI/YcgG family protein [unclassified Undibacterium]|uniref:YqcI/YcgG family protein n=1 Tax=unclassified Undibacterium TaxID=2630295 RepID=UPI002AC8DC1B|nr:MULTISPECIES: YqcI/YcgG family protein [unclassified Undibacterium]MEB0139134.1 YqcI/YcgG family protein [Undibacterium sp. CCC2.1]MEB0172886.1 YqcI/YcgG family protein [Undibacterium sp. CCC1.1]MEB0176642.1 YqcI/YcgG family protein [Undibacterium sp. CCC3.4]MEB0216030.1 YqcI/YcgG family protein [Undibacterium sp. 5I2]WPX43129.1 YqcI/YcgG family protein [Undibacterium sp. CCC3.4]